MPYKDKVKAREAARERQRKHRNVTPDDMSHPVTPKHVTPKILVDPKTFGYATRDVPGPDWMLQKRRE